MLWNHLLPSLKALHTVQCFQTIYTCFCQKKNPRQKHRVDIFQLVTSNIITTDTVSRALRHLQAVLQTKCN